MPRTAVMLFIFLFLALAAIEADAESRTLSLRDSLSMALDKNSRIRSATFSADAARQGTAIAASRYYPGVSFEEVFLASNAPTQTFMMKLDEGRFTQDDFRISNLNNPGTYHDFKSSLTIQQPLYVPSVAAMKDMASHSAERQRHSLDSTRQDTAFQVFRLYLDILRSRAQVTAADQAVAEALENLRLAKVRTSAGTGLISDELRSRTHLASLEQQRINVQNNQAIAKLHLAHAIGLQTGETFEVDDAIPHISPPPPFSELLTSALENRSDLKSVQSDKERADAAVRLARSDYFPTVGAFAAYQMNARDIPFGADNSAWSAGINLKWQIFDGFRRNREGDKAVAERSAAAENLDNASREIRLQIQESLLRRDEAQKLLEVARSSTRDAEETVRLLTKRFENSLATLAELLDAQTALNQARASVADAEAGYALAGGRVYHAAGIFLKEILK